MHRRMKSRGNGGGTPDWFFWTLAFIALVIAALVIMFGDRIWM